MNTKAIEVADINDIVLTNKGKVVGYIRVEHNEDFIRFVGKAVNIRLFSNSTFHSFACSSSITTDEPTDILIVDNFINALKVAN